MPTEPKRRSLVRRAWRALLVLGGLGLVGLVGLVYVLSGVPLPPEAIPVETTFLYDAAGNRLAELSGGENRVSVALSEVSETLVDAVLATEDRDFFSHPGVDATAIVRATVADLRGRPLQGGSTITQQYVKNVYVGNDRTIVRKLKEATLAVKLERRYDKEEILERYLNAIYFGRGAYGIEAAAQSYFGVDAASLDAQQSAYLAGLIRAPESADASRDAAAADRRRDLVLGSLVAVGRLSEEERADFVAAPVAALPGFRDRDAVVQDAVVGTDVGTEHFVEYVRSQLNERFGAARVNGGGLRVYTSLDLDLQRAAYDAVYTDVLNQPDDPAGALVALDTAGRVKAMVGGRSFGESRVNLAVGGEGGGAGRQAGSAFKPFVLAEAVSEGYDVESVLDSPASITFPNAFGGEDYEVSNYEGRGQGRIDIVEATEVSSNTVYAQMAEVLGPEAIAETAERLGIGPVDADAAGLSIALGTPPVSVLGMADAYLTFATRGVQVDPSAVLRVTDADGTVLFDNPPQEERVLEPAQADTVNAVLERVVEQGTGRGAAIGTPVAGKTGTTQRNGDAWFVGYTPGLSVAVWMGYPEGQSRPMDDVHGIAVTGGSFPAAAFKGFMEVATEREEYRGSFVDPPGGGERLVSAEDSRRQVTTTSAAPRSTTTTSRATARVATTTAPATTTTTEGTTPSSSTTTRPPGATITTRPPGATTTTRPPGATTTTRPPGATTTVPAPPPTTNPPVATTAPPATPSTTSAPAPAEG